MKGGLAEARRGAPLMLAAQLLISLTQFVYSGITARILLPEAFGIFVATIGLQGLLLLVTTTGLPSAVLRESLLTLGDIRSFRLIAWVSGLATAALFFALVAPWTALLNVSVDWVMAVVVGTSLIAAPASQVESALFRREHRTGVDAAILSGSLILSLAIATVLVWFTQSAWALATATLLNPVFLAVGSRTAQKAAYERGQRLRLRETFRYMRTVSSQNVVFYLLNQAPFWTASAVGGASVLGQVSRANTLAAVVSSSLTAALNRTVQPYWRHVDQDVALTRGVRDAIVISSGFAFPAAAVLCAAGVPLTNIWLGPGWAIAASLVGPLAAAAAIAVPTTVALTALEMHGRFRDVRWVQVGLATGAAVGLGGYFATRDVALIGVTVLLSQTCGHLVLLARLRAKADGAPFALEVATGASWSIVTGAAAYALGVWASQVSNDFHVSNFASAAAACGSAALLSAITFRWQPISRVLKRRGVRTPRWLTGPIWN